MGRQLALVEGFVGREKVCVGNVHLESLAENQQVRMNQMARLFPHFGDGSACVQFLCGDFNYDGNIGVNNNNKEEAQIPVEWRDVALLPGSLGAQNTLGVNYPYRKYPPGRFDRILMRDEQARLKLREAKFFGNELIAIPPASSAANKIPDFFSKRGCYISDHFGLFFRFIMAK